MTSDDHPHLTPHQLAQKRAAAKRGGEATKRKYAGTDHFRQITRKGGETMRDAFGSEFYAIIGAKGGRAKHRNARARKAAAQAQQAAQAQSTTQEKGGGE